MMSHESGPDRGESGPAAQKMMPVGGLASAILSTQFSALRAREAGTRDGSDPEELHTMRVAIRRLRAAVRLFEPALRPEAGRFREELGWVGGGLSAVRDLDVQLARLAEWRSQLDEDDQGSLDGVISAIGAQRDQARSDQARAALVGQELAAAGHRLRGVRLDSGDLAELTFPVREILDAAHLEDATIFAGGSLDEHVGGQRPTR